jgi:DNA repair protein RadA/Sms
MAKSKTTYVCQSCGQSFPGWSGKCASCGEWNTLVEELAPPKTATKLGSHQISEQILSESIISFTNVKKLSVVENRISTGISELDRVLGGKVESGDGIVPSTQGIVPAH